MARAASRTRIAKLVIDLTKPLLASRPGAAFCFHRPTAVRVQPFPPTTRLVSPLSPEMLFEKLDRARPSELRRAFVETRRRVVMKPVVRSRIHVRRVADAGFLQRRLVGRPSFVHPLIEFRV